MNNKYKNSYIVKEKELVSLSVYNVGFQSCDSLYQWGPGIRDHYLIHYIISGKGRYTVNGSVHTLTPGDAFLVYPNTEVIYQADAQDPWEYTWVGFTGSDAATILRATDFTKAHPYIHSVSNGNEIKRQLMHIYDARGTEFENALEMTGRLYTTLALFVSAATSKPPQNSANSYVQKGIEYISANYSYPITVEDIASYIGLSRSHLFRSFQSILGVSPKEYLTDFRIKQACYLLKHSSLSITAIAGSIGFDNSLYFSKTFHKIKGLSPKEYRSKYEKREKVKVLVLNTKNVLIKIIDVSYGGTNSAIIEPKDILAEPTKMGAPKIILVHNHPSGDPTPSKEDIETTKRLYNAATLLGIELLDHIIIGNERYTSVFSIGGLR